MALSIGAVFLVRFLWQIKDYFCLGAPVSPYNVDDDAEVSSHNVVDNDNRNGGGGGMLFLLKKYSSKFLLQVLGGGGAIWGFSEVCTLRRSNTLEFWRVVALTTATIFLIRFILQIIRDSFMSDSRRKGTVKSISQKETERLETIQFWRVAAVTTAFIFLIRFALQILRGSLSEGTPRKDTTSKKVTIIEAEERLELTIAASGESSLCLEENTPLVIS
jgi:hypothetical protein